MRRRRGDQQLVVNIAINDELVSRIALVELNGVHRPLRQFRARILVRGCGLGSGHQTVSFCGFVRVRPYACSRSLMADSSSPKIEPPRRSLASSISAEMVCGLP